MNCLVFCRKINNLSCLKAPTRGDGSSSGKVITSPPHTAAHPPPAEARARCVPSSPWCRRKPRRWRRQRGAFRGFAGRRRGTERLIRPISARYMHEKELRRYAEIYETEETPNLRKR